METINTQNIVKKTKNDTNPTLLVGVTKAEMEKTRCQSVGFVKAFLQSNWVTKGCVSVQIRGLRHIGNAQDSHA